MVNFEPHKKLIEQMLNHTCNVYEFVAQFNKETKRIVSKETLVHKDIPCKLSQSISETGLDKTSNEEGYNKISRHIKLFISNDTEIKAGSKIIVNYNGLEETFKNASVPAVYPTHQEVVLERFINKA